MNDPVCVVKLLTFSTFSLTTTTTKSPIGRSKVENGALFSVEDGALGKVSGSLSFVNRTSASRLENRNFLLDESEISPSF